MFQTVPVENIVRKIAEELLVAEDSLNPKII